MNEDLVRRIAKAVKRQLLLDAASDSPNIDCEAIARVAIEAMYEPDDNMVRAGHDVHDFDEGLSDAADTNNRENVRLVWKAMVKAAAKSAGGRR